MIYTDKNLAKGQNPFGSEPFGFAQDYSPQALEEVEDLRPSVLRSGYSLICENLLLIRVDLGECARIFIMKKYQPGQLEGKWQKRWGEENLYVSNLERPRKFYVLAEFPYPSGDLHMGHWFTFSGADIYARLKRMQGYNVFFPNGFDAFGLPAENAAIKRDIHPRDWTLSNIARMKEQFNSMGASFTFDHEVITCLPEYYKWNQWIFLRMLEKGLAYRGKYLSNWCNVCQTVLANEGVEAGSCWRCGTEVEQKPVDQWFFKITDYAERLIWKDESEGPERSRRVNWPKAVREAQNNWIGKSEGALVKFRISSLATGDSLTRENEQRENEKTIEVFTTRPDTLFGATFIVISPEHPVLTSLASSKIKNQNSKIEEVKEYIEKAKKKSELERKENKDKTGVFTGIYVKNPMSGKDIPVWVADYVLAGYGTGAIMAVPAHDQRDFEFAKKFGLEIKPVIVPVHLRGVPQAQHHLGGVDQALDEVASSAYEGDGVLVNSGEYNGLSVEEAKKAITDYLESHQLGTRMVYYHLHDWSISRQRYWGTPIPVIHCEKCGVVSVPDEDLPVELPYDVDYTPKGKSPLASNEEWLNVKCPKCGGPAKREAETMDTFVDSSWYFFRFLDPKLDSAPFDKELAEKIMPIDVYFGGAEHTLGHTLYARFFTKFFNDLGLTDLEEFAARRINHGIVLGPDGNKMSKSKGNVVNPDEEVKKYGADTVRVFLAFAIPYETTGPWVPERVWGPYRFLERVWNLFDKVAKPEVSHSELAEESLSTEDLVMLNRTVKKVGEDIEAIKYNTAIAALMEWLNHLSRRDKISGEEYRTMLLLLAPFAPHMAEELWQLLGEGITGGKGTTSITGSRESLEESPRDTRDTRLSRGTFLSIHNQPWPKFDEKYLEEKEVTIAISVDGKVRDQLVISKDIASNSKVVEKMALESQKVQKFIEGKEIKKVVYIPVKIINLVTD